MDIKISPKGLNGFVQAVDSKSDAHRLLISAALSSSPTTISISHISKDIQATINCLNELGCVIEKNQDDSLTVKPLWGNIAQSPALNCGESGSTLRFIIPVAAALCREFTVTGCGRLPERPLAPVVEAMKTNGCGFDRGALPMKINGMLTSGRFALPGDVSSQFISGLLFALPLLEGKSEIILTSPLESAGYVDMTIDTLQKFGISIIREQDRFIINGCQQYVSPGEAAVEGDWSNAAFWLAAGAIGGNITVSGLAFHSLQRDKQIADILRLMGAAIDIENDVVRAEHRALNAITIDAAEIPDLVPVMAAVMAVAKGTSVIQNIGRVRLKESDRLHAMAQNLNAIGAQVQETEDSLIITGKDKLSGGETQGYNDHRIVMALAAVSVACEKEITIKGAQAVEKSYPGFFGDFTILGGRANVI